MINRSVYLVLVTSLGLTFFAIFMYVVVPPLILNPDVVGAFMAGFVNPYSSGYSIDVIVTWCILCVWVMYESNKVKHGWVCLLLGLVPGVAVGFALYLFLRDRQLTERDIDGPNARG